MREWLIEDIIPELLPKLWDQPCLLPSQPDLGGDQNSLNQRQSSWCVWALLLTCLLRCLLHIFGLWILWGQKQLQQPCQCVHQCSQLCVALQHFGRPLGTSSSWTLCQQSAESCQGRDQHFWRSNNLQWSKLPCSLAAACSVPCQLRACNSGTAVGLCFWNENTEIFYLSYHQVH